MHLGKGVVALWTEIVELNCPGKLGWEPGMVRGGGLRMAQQRWSAVEVGAGVQP